MEKQFDSNKYKNQYSKDHYLQIYISLSHQNFETLEKFAENLGLSKNALLQKCLIYCYENDIDLT